MNKNYSQMTTVAINAALEAGNLLRKGFGTTFEISSKEGKQNLVTEYDKLSEKTLISSILHHFPEHSILAEESGSLEGESSVTWIIDPLDGTVNFAHGAPMFCVSIAVAVNNEVVSGVIYHPLLNELFVAEKRFGAYLNGKRLSVSKVTQLEEALLATGFPYNVDQNPLQCIDHFANFTKEGYPIRRFGSAALDLAYVAAGRFEGYWEVSLFPWDMAAGFLIVEEAGGKVSLMDGGKRDLFSRDNILATNGLLHSQMIDKFKL